MWQLILILSATTNAVGVYDTKEACEADAARWSSRGVVAGCVQQLSQEQAATKAQSMIDQFFKVVNSLENK